MAKIIFHLIDNAKLAPRSQILFHRKDPSKIKRVEEECRITSTSLETLVERSDLLLLCVRPPQAKEVLARIKEVGAEGKKLLSILAGVKASALQQALGPETEVIRAMPNLPLKAGKGMTVLSYGESASADFKSLAKLIFASGGRVAEMRDSFMDAAVSLSGSGPAFVISLIEAMAKAGEGQGIAYADALQIAAQTFAGAAELILNGGAPVDLITEIAVPGGTTEAGLNRMLKEDMRGRFESAILDTARRSAELGR
jgi:pyrroline-5-carboxylate reductase